MTISVVQEWYELQHVDLKILTLILDSLAVEGEMAEGQNLR